jgi:hypothetical protein
MQGIPFWRTAEFWTALLTVIAIVLSHIVPDLKDTVDQLLPHVITLVVALVVRTTVVQAVQFARGNSYNSQTNRWENMSFKGN